LTESRGEIPEKIDRYEIIEAVGYGAMGAVYKAFDPLIKRPVAVKTLRLDVPPDSPDYKAFLDRFATEARTAGRLSHPNIVTLYDVAPVDDKTPWLAMEYVEGQTVAELLVGERLRAEVVVGLVSQIASAIDYAHREGVVHRDIKPSNVIVHAGEKVKVTDFGIAKLMDAEITHSGALMGTPSYMSPEQAMGEKVDGRTDIFSLGVMAFEMLSGHQPFPGNNVTSILYKLVHTDPIRPDNLEVLGLLPDKWHDVFEKVLAKHPEERFETAAEFVKQLEHCLGSWFGALEGETVILKDASATMKPDVSPAPPEAPASEEVAPTEPAPEGDEDEDDDDRTLIDSPAVVGVATPASEGLVALETPAIEVDDELAGETVQMATQNEPEPPADVDAGETEIIEVGEAIATAHAPHEPDEPDEPDELDETVVVGAPVAPSPTATPAPAPAGGAPNRSKLFAAIGAAAVLAVVLLLVLTRGGDAPEAPVVEPAPVVVAYDEGRLSITTEPPGATVWIRDVALGETPLELTNVVYQSYVVRLEREGFATEERTLELSDDAPDASVDVALAAVPVVPQPAFVRVRSEPPGASIDIDGDAKGETPSRQVRVRTGERVIRLVLDGYLPWEDSVRARAGVTIDVDAELTARPEPAVEEQAPDPPPEPLPPPVVEGSFVERGEPGVVSPECISCPAVRYPEAARRTRQQGVVELGFVIDENGAVQDIQVRESAGEIFDAAVIATVTDWRYEPATKEGVRVKMRWVQRFRFRQGR